MKIGIIAALPGELKPLVKSGWSRSSAKRKTVQKWTARIGDADCVAACGGMGADAVRLAFEEAIADGPLDLVLSVGWAGALQKDLLAGSVSLASTVVDAQTGERFLLGAGEGLVLVTTTRVADAAEKRRLAESYLGAMVDMEAAAVLRLAQMRGVPVICMKAISDELGERLPDFNEFIDDAGQMRMAAFVLHAMLRPQYWGALVRMGRSSSKAAESLGSAILTFLTGPKDVAMVNRNGKVDW
jgi:adenosylhomocysteine nucleosidase